MILNRKRRKFPSKEIFYSAHAASLFYHCYYYKSPGVHLQPPEDFFCKNCLQQKRAVANNIFSFVVLLRDERVYR